MRFTFKIDNLKIKTTKQFVICRESVFKSIFNCLQEVIYTFFINYKD